MNRENNHSLWIYSILFVIGITGVFFCPQNSLASPVIFPVATNPLLQAVPWSEATSGQNVLLAILSGTTNIFGQDPANISFQIINSDGSLVGSNTVIGTGNSFPFAAYGGSNYLVYWDGGGSNPVLGQLISTNGEVIDAPFPIPSSGEGAPNALASDGTNFLAVYQTFDTNNNGNGLLGQFISSDSGVGLLGSPFQIADASNDGNNADAVFGNSNYLVVWQNHRADTNSNHNVTYGVLVSQSAEAVTNFVISQTESIDQNPLAAAFDGTNYFVVWNGDTNATAYNTNGGPTQWKLYGRLVSQAGVPLGNEMLLNTNFSALSAKSFSSSIPSLSFDGSHYLLGWSQNVFNGTKLPAGTQTNVWFQYYDTAAHTAGAPFTVFNTKGKNAPIFSGSSAVGSKFLVTGVLGNIHFDPNGPEITAGSIYGAIIPNQIQTNQTITFVQPSAKTYSPGGSFMLAATAPGGMVAFSSNNTNVISVTGSTANINGVGSVLITANQSGTASYAAAPPVSRTVTVKPAIPTIGALSLPMGATVGSKKFAIKNPSSPSMGAFSYKSSNPKVASVTGNLITFLKAGTTTITATQAANVNYLSGKVSAVLIVSGSI